MKITRREIAIALRLGTVGLIVGAVFSIANGNTLLGIAQFLAAELGILAAKRVSGKEQDTDEKQERNTDVTIGCMGILMGLLGVAGALNHILNTGESLVQPICITVFGAAAAWFFLRKKDN